MRIDDVGYIVLREGLCPTLKFDYSFILIRSHSFIPLLFLYRFFSRLLFLSVFVYANEREIIYRVFIPLELFVIVEGNGRAVVFFIRDLGRVVRAKGREGF